MKTEISRKSQYMKYKGLQEYIIANRGRFVNRMMPVVVDDLMELIDEHMEKTKSERFGIFCYQEEKVDEIEFSDYSLKCS